MSQRNSRFPRCADGFASIVQSSRLAAALLLALALSGTAIGSEHNRQLTVACSAAERLCQWLERDELGLRGIELQIEHRPAAEVLAAMQADPEHHGIDLWWGAPADRLRAAAESGLLQPIHPANLDQQLRWSTELWRTTEQQAVGISAATLGIIVNPIALSPTNLPAPRCWSDLGDPQYRGHLLLEDPALSSELFAAISLIRYQFDTAQADRLLQEIRRNAQNGLDQNALRRVAVGDRGITIAPIHEAVQLYSFYSPLVVHVPCEGTAFMVSGAAVPVTSSQFGPASAFIEYTLSSDFQSRVVEQVSPQIFSHPQATPSPIYQDRDYLHVINHDAARLFSEEERNRVLGGW